MSALPDLPPPPPPESHPPLLPPELPSAWYYAKGGERHGPVAEEVIVELMRHGVLDSTALVWRKGMAAWVPLRDAPIRCATAGVAIPAGSGGAVAVPNAIPWILAVAPIAYILGCAVVFTALGIPMEARSFLYIIVAVACNITLCSMDAKAISRAGVDPRRIPGWTFFLVPVYLFKRARALDQSPAYFVVWIASFLVSLFL